MWFHLALIIIILTSKTVWSEEVLEGRIFRFAPPNTQVSLNRPFRQFIYAHRDGCFLVIKEINGVSTPFVWSAIHQTLLSRQNVTLPLGDEFHFYLHAFCIEKRASEYRRAKVIVSERNYQQPNFTSSNFAFRVPLDAQKGYKVGTVRAFDTDKVIYNWQLEYDLLKDTKNILAIGDNGDIYLTKDISDVSNDLIINTNDVSHFPYVVLVQACDCGSPRKCSTATVEIAAVTITEPKDIQILAATEKYLIVCWKHPSYGLANFYQLHMVPSNRITTADLEIRIEADYSKAIQCAVQRETHEIGAGFSLILFAHDGKERTPSRVHNYQIGQMNYCNGSCFYNGTPMCVVSDKGTYEQFTYKNQPFCLCDAGYFGDNCEKAEYCESTLTDTKYGTFVWTKTDVYTQTFSHCPFGPTNVSVKRTCGYDQQRERAVWQEFLVTNGTCRSKYSVYYEMSQLEQSLRKDEMISYEKLDETAQLLNKRLNATYRDKEVGTKLINAVGLAMMSNKTLIDLNRRRALGRMFRGIVDNFTDNVAINKTTGEFVSVSDKISVFVRDLSHLNHSDGDVNWHLDKTTVVDIPEETLADIRDSEMHSKRLKIAVFESAEFFPTSRQTENGQKVIDIQWPNEHATSDLEKPITFKINVQVSKNFHVTIRQQAKYNQLLFKPGNYTCVYWEESRSEWEISGLTTVNSGKDGQVVCQTTHLTGFSILLDMGYGEEIDENHSYMLNLLSWIGCGISMSGLVLTIITYSLFRCLNRDHAGQILLNLSSAMFAMNLLFVISSLKPYVDYGYQGCIAIGALLHYFTLSSLLWMGVEAGNMYQMLVNVFASTEKFFMVKRYAAAWGIPAILVIISLSINVNNYNTADDIENKYCQLSKANGWVYYGTHLLPACLLLLANCIIFGLLLRVLIQSTNTRIGANNQGPKQSTTAIQIRGALTVMTLLGITWVFGAFAVGPARLPFTYVFSVLNSLQGFVIFLTRCLCYEEARLAWLMLIRTGKLKKHRGKTLTTTTSEQSNGNYKPLGKTVSSYSTIVKGDKKSVTDEKFPKITGGNREKKVLIVEDTNITNENPITPDTQLVRLQCLKFIEEPPSPLPPMTNESYRPLIRSYWPRQSGNSPRS